MGGFINDETLQYCESIPAHLDVGDYVAIDKPGEYSMIVMYHPSVSIALVPSIQGLICSTSVPIKLVVEPIVVESIPDEQANIVRLISGLPATGIVRIWAAAT